MPPVRNYLGYPGAYLADCVLKSFGLALPVFLLAFPVWGYTLLRQKEFLHPYSRTAAWILGVNFFAAFLALLPSWIYGKIFKPPFDEFYQHYL